MSSQQPTREVDGPHGAGGRRVAGRLAWVACGFVCAVVVLLLVDTVVEGRHRWLESAELVSLGRELRAAPTNEELATQIRELDRGLRHRYLTHRARRRAGAWCVLVGVVIGVGALRWAGSLAPFTAPGLPPQADEEAERQKRERRLGVYATAATAGASALVLLVLTPVFGVPRRDLAPLSPAAENEERPTRDDTGSLYGSEEWQRSWPQFRGPTAMGHVPVGDWPTTWDAEKGIGIVWRTPLPERHGNSSPVVWGDRLFYSVGDEVGQELYCVSLEDGEILWSADVEVPRRNPAAFRELNLMEETGYAASTPATDGRRVFVAFATTDIACFDFEGNEVWARNFGVPDNAYGLASSLVVYKDLVLWQLDQGADPEEGKAFLYALDVKSGRTVWRTPRPVPNSWASPAVFEVGGSQQILTCGAPFAIAYDPADGGELWRADVLSGDVAPMPVGVAGIVYVTNAGAQTAAIRADGRGDITKTHVNWTSIDGMPDTASPVTDGTYLVLAGSDGLVTCLDTKAGKMLWEKVFDCGFQASLALMGRRLYLWSDDGNTYVAELGPEYKQLSSGVLGEPVVATPAFMNGRIYMRGDKELFCIGGGE